MLVDYAYVFAYKYVLIGILYPLFVLGVVLYVDWHRSKEKANEKEKMEKSEVEMVKSEREKKGEQIGAGVHDDHPGYDGSSSSSSSSPSSLLWVEMLVPMLWRVGEYGGGDVVMGRGDGRGSVVMEEEKLSEVVNPMSTASKVGSCDVKGDGNSSRAVVWGSLDVSSNSTPTHVHCASLAAVASLSSPRSSSLCFSSGDYVIRVTMMVGCLLTFGAVLPYLSILIGFSIASNTYLTQLGWLRVLERYLCRESGLGKEEVEGKARQGVCEGIKVGEGKEVDNRVLEEEGEESVVEEASVSVRGERQEGKMKVDGDGVEEKAYEEAERCVLGQGVLGGEEGGRRGKWERLEMSMVKEKGMEKLLLELGGECSRMGSSLMRAGQPLLLLVPLFYAGYVFDPAGDEGGWLWGLYLVLSLLGVLLLLLVLSGGG
eukprot:scaffold1621_cov136-Ochromonas_danica.AAC.1